MFKSKSLLIALTLTALIIPAFATMSAYAQGPATPAATDSVSTAATPAATTPATSTSNGGDRSSNMQGLLEFRACSTTDYTDVAAKAIGITAAEVRVGLVSGKTIQDLAKDKNVSIDTITAAIKDAQKAEIAQAVTDGVITQAQADFISAALDRSPATGFGRGFRGGNNNNNGNGQGNGNATPPAQPQIAVRGLNLGISPYVTVNNEVVAAKAINISCAALVTAVQQGRQSIADVAKSKNVTAQTVIDALVKAQTAALDEDVSEGLITAAEKAGRSANLTQQMTTFVNGRGGRGIRPFGAGGGLGGIPCRMFGIGCNRPGGNPGNATPAPTATSAGTAG